jgi:hypothetical protein
VLARARALLTQLESRGAARPRPIANQHEDQLDLFQAREPPAPLVNAMVETLRALEIDRLSGLEALGLLARWKEKL